MSSPLVDSTLRISHKSTDVEHRASDLDILQDLTSIVSAQNFHILRLDAVVRLQAEMLESQERAIAELTQRLEALE